MSEKMIDMISILLNLLTLFYVFMWSLLQNVLWALEKGILYIPTNSTGLIRYILIFCLDVLSIDVSVLLKSPAIIVLLSMSLFRPINICFIYFVFLYGMYKNLQILYHLAGLTLLLLGNALHYLLLQPLY